MIGYLFTGILILICSGIAIGITYGKNPFKNTKSILPKLMEGNRTVRMFMFVLLFIGIYRVILAFTQF